MTYPTSFKIEDGIKKRLDAYNEAHPETPLRLNIFLNQALAKWLHNKGF